MPAISPKIHISKYFFAKCRFNVRVKNVWSKYSIYYFFMKKIWKSWILGEIWGIFFWGTGFLGLIMGVFCTRRTYWVKNGGKNCKKLRKISKKARFFSRNLRFFTKRGHFEGCFSGCFCEFWGILGQILEVGNCSSYLVSRESYLGN